MRHRSTLALAALAAIGTLAAATGLASAGRLSVNIRPIRAVWERLEFEGRNGLGSVFFVRCQVTLEGSFHSTTLRKTSGVLIGYISRATARACAAREAAMVALQETLPWHVRYRGFSGTLPNISTVTVGMIGMGWRLDGESLHCRFQSTAANPAIGSFHLRLFEEVPPVSFAWDPEAPIPLIPTIECLGISAELRLGGTSKPVTQLGGTTTLSITLI